MTPHTLPAVRLPARQLLALAATAALALPAHALTAAEDIELSYSITGLGLPDGYAGTIYGIGIFNGYEFNSGASWPAQVAASGGTITDVFRKSSSNRPLAALMVGLIDDLPGDGSAGQTHLVLMLNTAAAQAARGIAWGTSFPTVLEDSLIADVRTAFTTTRGEQTPEATWDAALDRVSSFVDGHQNLWFALAASQPGTTVTSQFAVMAWSDGQQIGTGVASVTQAVPEPGTWALMLGGMAAMGGWLRRRHQSGG
ncbi:PEP-CTERM sorting domain-containing protein [uncultured Aquincola sp.]|mgnify:CR=1 FL=1|uniref:PEP-CTERM sorting domain-containing protein n=1 Tax=uncultured Aquincola sp. TaxID=886556 RepID=UPI0032B11D9F